MLTAGDLLRRKRHGRCPDCDRQVRVAPRDGSWCWTCPNCDRSGLGFPSREAIYEGLERLRNRG